MNRLLPILAVLAAAAAVFAQTAPKTPPPSSPEAAVTAPPTTPLPAGAKVAYVNLQYIAFNSAEGKAANAKVEAFVQKRRSEATASKVPLDQRFQQSLMQDVQKMRNDLQIEFQKKLFPVLEQLAKDKHLSMLLSSQDAGLIWTEPGLDLTAEAIKRFDAATAATPKR